VIKEVWLSGSKPTIIRKSALVQQLRGCIKVAGSAGSACKKIGRTDAINVTVINSGKIALPEFVKNVSIYFSSFNLIPKFAFFTWAVIRRIHAAHWSGTKLQIEWLREHVRRVDSRISEFVKKMIFINCVGIGKVFVIK